MSHLTLDILLQSQTKVTSSQYQHKIRANGEFNLFLLDITQFPSIISFWTLFDCSMFRENQNYFSILSLLIDHTGGKMTKTLLGRIYPRSIIFILMDVMLLIQFSL